MRWGNFFSWFVTEGWKLKKTKKVNFRTELIQVPSTQGTYTLSTSQGGANSDNADSAGQGGADSEQESSVSSSESEKEEEPEKDNLEQTPRPKWLCVSKRYRS